MLMKSPFKPGDRVICTIKSKITPIVNDRVLTVKAVKHLSRFWFLTFEEIEDSEIRNGVSSNHFIIASDRKNRIDKLNL